MPTSRTEWAKARHGDDPLVIRERWRDLDDDLFGSPRNEDLFAS